VPQLVGSFRARPAATHSANRIKVLAYEDEPKSQVPEHAKRVRRPGGVARDFRKPDLSEGLNHGDPLPLEEPSCHLNRCQVATQLRSDDSSKRLDARRLGVSSLKKPPANQRARSSCKRGGSFGIRSRQTIFTIRVAWSNSQLSAHRTETRRRPK